MSTLEDPDRCNTHTEGSSTRFPPPPFVTSQGYLVRARLEGDAEMKLSMDVAKHDAATQRFLHCGRARKKTTSSSVATTVSDAIYSDEKLDRFLPGSSIQCAAEVVCWSLDSKRVCVLITRGIRETDGGIAAPPILATMSYGDPSTVESVVPVLGPKEWNWEKVEGSKWAIVDGPTLLCLGGKDVAVSFSRLKGGDGPWTIKIADSNLTRIGLPMNDGEQPLKHFRKETHATMLENDDGQVLVCYSKMDKVGVGLPRIPHFPWFEVTLQEKQSPTWKPWQIPAQGATALAYCPFSNGRILYMAVETRLMIIGDGLLLSVISLPAAVKNILPLPSERSSSTSGLALLLADESRTSIIVPLPLPLMVSLSDVCLKSGDGIDSPHPSPQGYWTPYLGVGAIVAGDFDRSGRWKLAMLPVPLDAPWKLILKNTVIQSVSVLSCILGYDQESRAGFPFERIVELPRAEKSKGGDGEGMKKRKRRIEVEGKKGGESGGLDENQTLEQLQGLNKVLLRRLLMEEEQLERDKLIHRFRKSLLKTCQGTILKLTENDGYEGGNIEACSCNSQRDLKCVYKLDTLEEKEEKKYSGRQGGIGEVPPEHGGMEKVEAKVELLGKYFHATRCLLIVTGRLLNKSCSTTMEQACLSLSSERGTLSSHSTVVSKLSPGESAVLSTEAQILPRSLLSTRNATNKGRDWELHISVSCHWINGRNGRDVVCLFSTINISPSELLGLESYPLQRSIMLHGCNKEVVLLVESEFVDLSQLSRCIEELSLTCSYDTLIMWGTVSIENVSRRRVHIRLMLRDTVFLEPLLLALNRTLPDGVKLSVDFEALMTPLCIAFCSALREEIALTNSGLYCTDNERFISQTLLSDSLAIDIFSQTRSSFVKYKSKYGAANCSRDE